MNTVLDALIPLFAKKNQAAVLLAPAGQGKTSMIIDYIKCSHQHVIFVSPLRALAEELFERMEKEGIVVKCPRNRSEAANVFQGIGHQSKLVAIITPEIFDDDWWDTIQRQSSTHILLVFDECHLFFYWGDHFRPRLLEFLDASLSTEINLLFLTATLALPLQDRLREMLAYQREDVFIFNLGNQMILRPPERMISLPPFMLKPAIFWFLDWVDSPHCIIVFCRFRKEVLQWEQELNSLGINALGCLGGEGVIFRQKLKRNPSPQVIVATSVLGHGVNLPSCHLILMTYHEQNPDLALQMMARGGRRGESYSCIKPVVPSELFRQNKPHWEAIRACGRDFFQCTLGALYGWLVYPSFAAKDKLQHDRLEHQRRHHHQKNALSGAPSLGDPPASPWPATNSLVLWWSRRRETAERNGA